MDMSSTSSMSSMDSMTMTGGMSMSTEMPMTGTGSMNSTSMSMNNMAMVFFTSASTPLYSWSWTPNNQGQYAGTCIFLIVLAAIFRSLLFLRTRSWTIIGSKSWEGHPGQTQSARKPRWRTSTAVKLATLDTILAGVGYLLMLAVMTMNVGYFMSVLAGVFLGSMIFGQHTSTVMGSTCY